MDAEARLEDALHAAHNAKGDQVKTEQWAWIKRNGAEGPAAATGKFTAQPVACAKRWSSGLNPLSRA